MRQAIAWFAEHSVAANLLLVLIVLSGLSSVINIPQKSFPDIDVKIITVTVPYLGAAPEEVESGVCIRIEEELEGIEGIDRISSTANEGLCSVTVELFEYADDARALDDVKNRIDAIDTFPDETEKPIVTLVSPVRSVLDIAVTGPEDERTLKVIGQQVRDDIASLAGVTQVALLNTRPYEIAIDISEQSLRRNGLSFSQVADAIRTGSLDLPGGSIKTRAGEILLRTKGQAYSGLEYEQLVILTRADGTRLYLRDVASVIDGFEDTDQLLRFDGKPAAMVRVSRVGEQDILAITRAVKDYLANSQGRLPPGITLTVWNDNSKMLRDRLDTLLNSARQGFLMVLMLLAIFLRPRLAFWVSVGVPVAFMGGLFMVNWFGLSIDGISLFGFILVLGILVDDAIVVGESVHSAQQRSHSLMVGAIKGTQKVSTPVIFGVLTTFAAFMPLMLAPGTIGQIFSVIATIVMCCLTFSLIESQLVLPAHLGHQKVTSAAGEIGLLLIPITGIVLLEFAWDFRSYLALIIAVASLLFGIHLAGWFEPVARKLIVLQESISNGLERLIQNQFRAVAERAIEYRYITLSIALVAFMSCAGILASGRLPFSFFPPLEADQVIAKLTMPLGTPASITEAAILQLEQSGLEVAELLAEKDPAAAPVNHILSALGSHPSSEGGAGPPQGGNIRSSGGHLGEVTMQLTPGQSRDLSTREIANIWRDQAGVIADAVELKFQTSLFTVGEAINIQLEGDDVDELRIVAERLRHKLSEYPGVIDITDSFRSGKQELKLNILPAGEALGLSLGMLASQVRQAFYGEEVQRIQRGRDDVRVMLRYTETERQSLSTLDRMRIRTPQGDEVPFVTVAEADIGRGFSSIKRSERQRVVNVVADVDRTQITANEVIADLKAGAMEQMLAEYPRISYGLEGQQREQGEALASLLPSFVIALFVIYTLLAVPLNSYSQPLVIMSVIPFALVGAIWGHIIMKSFGLVSGLAMMSVMGFIAASGVVVNSSLVLVHHVNFLREAGASIRSAVLDAAASRCRPIILTSLTTFVGLLPLMLNRSVQAQFLVPMATSLAFGVLFATMVTLLVVPSGYLVLNDLQRKFANLVGALKGLQPASPVAVGVPDYAELSVSELSVSELAANEQAANISAATEQETIESATKTQSDSETGDDRAT
ncbi:MAG: efflux RND transporter permease subunit [Pseudomonadales bacterium]|nr:efflux RND transporter permease subunit [Pseudomonadales bacterium]